MKPEELRIGNWVTRRENEVAQVSSIIDGLFVNFGEYHDAIVNIKRIPLTEEWLFKFGFECIGKNTDFEMFCIGYKEDNSDGAGYYECDFELNKNDDGSFHVELSSVDIKHVHQLQNLYYALTGIELEIQVMA